MCPLLTDRICSERFGRDREFSRSSCFDAGDRASAHIVDALLSSGRAQLEWIADHRTPLLDLLARLLTALGDEPFLLFFVALGYWAVHRRTFARAALLLILAVLLNGWLKGIFREARPQVEPLVQADGWSFPSGHAQAAAAMWGWLALHVRRRVGAAALWILALGVAASRPYLGVHYLHDVGVGFVLGAAQLGLYRAWQNREPFLRTWLSPAAQWAAGLTVVGSWVVFGFDETVVGGGVRLFGALVGLGLGWLRESARDVMRPPHALWARAGTVGIGTLGLVAIWLGLSVLYRQAGVDGVLPLQFIRYVLVGLWISAGAPTVARRLFGPAAL